MAKIIIARVRTNHELTWRVPPAVRGTARTLHLGYVDRVLSSIDGRPFLAQMTTYYLAALGEAAARARGTDHTFEVLEGTERTLEFPDDADVVLFTVNTPAALAAASTSCSAASTSRCCPRRPPGTPTESPRARRKR
jgi:hypothetical protein